jgi:broad specificity phosphatase PhoE
LPAILLLRHAQASFGAADYDVLSARGHDQAVAVAEELRRRNLVVARVISGTLTRQRETAGPVARSLRQELEICSQWDEYDSDDVMTHHSGSPARQDVRPDAGGPAVTSRQFQDVLEPALASWIAAGPDGPASETWEAFAGRTVGAVRDLADELGPGQTAVVCTSGGVIAAITAALLAVPAQTFVALNRVTINTGLTMLAHGRSGTSLVSFNEHAHLQRPGGSLLTYR